MTAAALCFAACLAAQAQNLLFGPGHSREPQQVTPASGPHFAPPPVPEYIVFAGDTVRFDRPDMYERMDRELIAFTYSHSVSVLMYKRSLRYFTEVVGLLKSQGIPDDLKYLMVIESNLDPKAYSAAGAAGLWQFTKGTAQAYGLEVNAEVDERYNIEKETLAACRYMLDAYSKYGDWLTVAASYNAGQNGISKRLADQRQRSAVDLWMPEETTRYIYRLLVAKMFFSDPGAFGFDLGPEDRYPYYEPGSTVTVSGPIPSLVDFAEKYGVTYAQLKQANIWLRDSKLTNKAGRTYRIRIP